MSDLISREAAIEAIDEYMDKSIELQYLPTGEGIKTLILSLPTAERVGKWMEQERGIHTTKYRCSECGRVVWDDTGYDVCTDYPYCNCGARMRGDEDETD